jgi:hypothetical protein
LGDTLTQPMYEKLLAQLMEAVQEIKTAAGR